MKKLLSLVLVLGMASIASAGLSIAGYDGSKVKPSDQVALSIVGDGQIAEAINVFLLVEFEGRINGGAVVWAPADPAVSSYRDKESLDAEFGMDSVEMFNNYLGKTSITDLASVVIASTTAPHPALNGLIVDGIIFHLEGPGDAIVTLCDASFSAMDTITIHQIPEPASMLLLGLGGLFLRRQ